MRLKIVLFIVLIATGCDYGKPRSLAHSDRPCVESDRYGLQSISKESDSLEIRIWYDYSLVDRVPVVSIRQSKTGEWSGKLYIIIWSFDEERPKVKEVRIRNLRPNISWPSLHARLEELQIISIPDMDIEDRGLDGSSYRFEIEMDGSCWTYSYWMPADVQERNSYARNVVQILDTIESELGVPWGMENDEQRNAFWTMTLDSTLTLY